MKPARELGNDIKMDIGELKKKMKGMEQQCLTCPK